MRKFEWLDVEGIVYVDTFRDEWGKLRSTKREVAIPELEPFIGSKNCGELVIYYSSSGEFSTARGLEEELYLEKVEFREENDGVVFAVHRLPEATAQVIYERFEDEIDNHTLEFPR